MDIRVSLPVQISKTALQITGSKSETNRLLLLQALFPEIVIKGASESDDSDAMREALSSGNTVIDVHHAGTAMRFLTAYFAVQQGREVVITGSSRMKERPIEILVTALQDLGADIEYLEVKGYPPLKIVGKKLQGNTVNIKAGTSSQYITALMLVGPKLEKGLTIIAEGTVISRTYIEMTLSIMQEAGIDVSFIENVITVPPVKELIEKIIIVESDWSSASYFYSLIAMSPMGTRISLSSYKSESRQGDSALVSLYQRMGVVTKFHDDSSITLIKENEAEKVLCFDLNNTPDIAQTIAVSCFGLGVACTLTGLQTLKIKETDRLEALKNELQKLGAVINVTSHSLSLEASKTIKDNVVIETYDDHRMAMAFAPLAVKGVSIVIKDAGVVSKSYPTFWEDMKRLGLAIQTV